MSNRLRSPRSPTSSPCPTPPPSLVTATLRMAAPPAPVQRCATSKSIGELTVSSLPLSSSATPPFARVTATPPQPTARRRSLRSFPTWRGMHIPCRRLRILRHSSCRRTARHTISSCLSRLLRTWRHTFRTLRTRYRQSLTTSERR